MPTSSLYWSNSTLQRSNFWLWVDICCKNWRLLWSVYTRTGEDPKYTLKVRTAMINPKTFFSTVEFFWWPSSLLTVITDVVLNPVHFLQEDCHSGHSGSINSQWKWLWKIWWRQIGWVAKRDFKSKKARSASTVQTNLVPFLRRSERAAEMSAKWGTNLR